jgi:hypothetical protein
MADGKPVRIDRTLYRNLPIKDTRITLCGSTRFMEHYNFWETHLTLAGNVVYSVAIDAHNTDEKPTGDEKAILDVVHLKKISNSDAIFVLNVDGYIGESTGREIDFALKNGKGVFYLSDLAN